MATAPSLTPGAHGPAHNAAHDTETTPPTPAGPHCTARPRKGEPVRSARRSHRAAAVRRGIGIVTTVVAVTSSALIPVRPASEPAAEASVPLPAAPIPTLTLTVESGAITLDSANGPIDQGALPTSVPAVTAKPTAIPTLRIDSRTTIALQLAPDQLDLSAPSSQLSGAAVSTARRSSRGANAAQTVPNRSLGLFTTASTASTTAPAAAATDSAATTDPSSIPVLIVHGTWSNTAEVEPLKENLEAQGLTVYSYNYGHSFSLVGLLAPDAGGMQDMNQSVQDLAEEIAKVKAETGSNEIYLVGHSQGGLLIKDYLANYQDDGVVKVVDLGASNHGTDFGGGAVTLLDAYLPELGSALNSVFGTKTLQYYTSGRFLIDAVETFPKPMQSAVRWIADRFIDAILGVAPRQQLLGSSFINSLNKTPDTKAGVSYLVISTKDDEYVTPYKSTYLSAVIGAEVENLEVHSLPSVLASDVVHHDDLLTNTSVATAVADFLKAPTSLDPEVGTTVTVDGGTTTVTQVMQSTSESTSLTAQNAPAAAVSTSTAHSAVASIRSTGSAKTATTAAASSASASTGSASAGDTSAKATGSGTGRAHSRRAGG
jgi:triacylglycerol esterase/lipase EstA (alpha/beta hydrolase family)